MSSTTSSDCESCDCSQCMYLFENNQNDYEKLVTNSRHVPMYATMAHPFIYYAEVVSAGIFIHVKVDGSEYIEEYLEELIGGICSAVGQQCQKLMN